MLPKLRLPRAMPDYRRRLNILKLDALLYRRTVDDLVLAFKILRGETKLKPSKYWVFRPCRGRVNLLLLRSIRMDTSRSPKTLSNFFTRCARTRLKRIELLSVLRIEDF